MSRTWEVARLLIANEARQIARLRGALPVMLGIPCVAAWGVIRSLVIDPSSMPTPLASSLAGWSAFGLLGLALSPLLGLGVPIVAPARTPADVMLGGPVPPRSIVVLSCARSVLAFGLVGLVVTGLESSDHPLVRLLFVPGVLALLGLSLVAWDLTFIRIRQRTRVKLALAGSAVVVAVLVMAGRSLVPITDESFMRVRVVESWIDHHAALLVTMLALAGLVILAVLARAPPDLRETLAARATRPWPEATANSPRSTNRDGARGLLGPFARHWLAIERATKFGLLMTTFIAGLAMLVGLLHGGSARDAGWMLLLGVACASAIFFERVFPKRALAASLPSLPLSPRRLVLSLVLPPWIAGLARLAVASVALSLAWPAAAPPVAASIAVLPAILLEAIVLMLLMSLGLAHLGQIISASLTFGMLAASPALVASLFVMSVAPDRSSLALAATLASLLWGSALGITWLLARRLFDRPPPGPASFLR